MLGRVLMQENHVITYESIKLKDHEKKYDVYGLDLATVIHALKFSAIICHEINLLLLLITLV